MTRRIRNDKFPFGGGKIPVGHIDGDALFALRLKAISQQREVDAFFAATL